MDADGPYVEFRDCHWRSHRLSLCCPLVRKVIVFCGLISKFYVKVTYIMQTLTFLK